MPKFSSKIESWFGLKNTAVVVAGANGLIGMAVAKALQECGARVIEIDLQFDNQAETIQIPMDLTDPKSLTDFFEKLEDLSPNTQRWAFVNCAYPRTENWAQLGFENVTLDDWNLNLSLNLGSSFHFTKESVLFLKKHGGGSIINLGSIYGLQGPDLSVYQGTSMKNPVPYSAIKAGIVGLTRYVATVYGCEGIRANVICPGGIRNGQPDSFIQSYEAKTPLGRMGTPNDIAGVVAFFVSHAADYITGQVISIDGGWTAW